MTGAVEMCPVCRKHSDPDSLAAQQVVLRGCQAILEKDDQMIEDIYSILTPYDGHTAISLFLAALIDISKMTGIPLQAMIGQYRANLSAAQTQTPE